MWRPDVAWGGGAQYRRRWGRGTGAAMSVVTMATLAVQHTEVGAMAAPVQTEVFPSVQQRLEA